MIIPFKVLPASGTVIARPIVDVHLEGEDGPLLPCLVDTGAVHNRFGRWTAEAVGLDLEGADRSSFGLGGTVVVGATVAVDLQLGAHRWRAPVTFCDPWPFGFQILGQEGFLRYFIVTIRASAFELAVEPDSGPSG